MNVCLDSCIWKSIWISISFSEYIFQHIYSFLIHLCIYHFKSSRRLLFRWPHPFDCCLNDIVNFCLQHAQTPTKVVLFLWTIHHRLHQYKKKILTIFNIWNILILSMNLSTKRDYIDVFNVIFQVHFYWMYNKYLCQSV